MTKRLQIAVADDEPDMQEYFEKMLPRLGHEVTSVATTGRELVEHCRQSRPDLVITDIKMPDMDGIEAASVIYQEMGIPIILVSAYHSPDLIERAEADHIMAYLVKPIKYLDLEPAIALAVRRFEQFQSVQNEAVNLRQALDDRRIVERAKGIVMKRGGFDEQAAFERLQKLSSDHNQKMIEVARNILLAEEAFRP